MYSIYISHSINSPYVRFGQRYRDKRKAIENARDLSKPAEVRDGRNIMLFHNGRKDFIPDEYQIDKYPVLK